MARKTGSVVETPKPDVNFFEDDSYELLAKGIGGYNQGAATFSGNQSWIDTLIATSKNSNTVATAIEYALDILHSADKGIALPYRQYIWKGGTYDANLTDAEGNPDPKAGQDWCFGYGEEEWLAGKTFNSVRQNASDFDKDGNLQTPKGRVSCE